MYEKIVSAMSCIILLTGRARLVTCQLLQHMEIAQTSILHLFVKVSVKIFDFPFSHFVPIQLGREFSVNFSDDAQQ